MVRKISFFLRQSASFQTAALSLSGSMIFDQLCNLSVIQYFIHIMGIGLVPLSRVVSTEKKKDIPSSVFEESIEHKQIKRKTGALHAKGSDKGTVKPKVRRSTCSIWHLMALWSSVLTTGGTGGGN